MPEVIPPRNKFGTHRPIEDNKGTIKSQEEGGIWLDRARQAYNTSTDFIDTNLRQTWDDNIAHFQNRHMQGSKYHSAAYKYRSKMFRPKTRSTIRQVEAATAASFFSQLDVMDMEPMEEKNPLQEASAAFRKEMINYRLTGKDQIPWFQICVGAMQEANVYAVVGSKQFWDYQEQDVDIQLSSDQQTVLDQNGNPASFKHTIKVVDKPCIKLYPIECLRFDPAAEWTDVVNSSPYFIAMESMRIDDVKQKMAKGIWKKLDDNLLLQARNAAFDSTRNARDNDKEDSKDPRYSEPLSDFDLVWVHENFMRIAGQEVQYYTLGTVAMLTDPKPLKKAYLHGRRPFVVGTCVIEAHKPFPDAPAHLAKGTQKEANEIANTRLDNVKLVLNKRWIAKRGRQVDLQSLVRNAPGSVTLANDTTDVLPVEFNDVTGSAYAEQDRVNVDLDELLGSFSAGSIATNRKLGETVGGLQMLRGTSNTMAQYIIRIFSETWVEKVLNQIDELEQYYESDLELMTMIAKRADIGRWGIEAITEELLMAPCRLSVNVANSAQDPTVRLELFSYAMRTYAEFRQIMPPDMDPEPIKAYLFGLLGFRNAKRFSVDTDNPQMQAAQQMIQQLQQALESKMMDIQAKNETTYAKIESDRQTAIAELVQKEEESRRDLEAKLAEMSHKIQSEERQAEQQNRVDLFIARMQESTKLLIAEMQQANQNSMAQAGEETKRFIAALQADTKALIASLTQANSEKAANDSSRQTEALQEAIEALTQERETEVIERDADGLPSKTRSKPV